MLPEITIHIDTSKAKKGVSLRDEILKKTLADIYGDFGMEISVITEHLASDVYLAVEGKAAYFPASLPDEIIQYIDDKSPENDGSYFTELMVRQIFWIQPRIFFTPEICNVYLGKPSAEDIWHTNLDETIVAEIVISLLENKCLPGNPKMLIDFLNEVPLKPAINTTELQEILLEKFLISNIEVKINPSYFRDLLEDSNNNDTFKMVRDGLFYETGLIYPRIKYIPDASLPGNTFYFQLNKFSSIPMVGIAKNLCLANDSPDRLKILGVEDAIPAINPANLKVQALISIEDKIKAEEAGLTTWGIQGHFVLCLSAFLRKFGYCFINRLFPNERAENLKAVFPELIELFLDCVKPENASYVLRNLAKENVSLLNMKMLMELMIEADYIDTEDIHFIVFDNRYSWPGSSLNNKPMTPAMITEFVRAGMKRAISNYYLKGQSTLVVYLVDREIEQLIFDAITQEKAISEADTREIFQAVDREFEFLPFNQQKIILTSQSLRYTLKKIIEASYPEVAVIAYQELIPEINIQPIARISL